jgi:hypothetical protein
MIFRQLRVSCCGEHSLTRGRVFSLQLLLGLAGALFLGSKPRETPDHNSTVSNLRLPKPRGSGSCIYFLQEQGGSVLPPGVGFNLDICELWLITSRHGPLRNTHPSSSSTVSSRGPAFLPSFGVYRLLLSKGCCLESHYLRTGIANLKNNTKHLFFTS